MKIVVLGSGTFGTAIANSLNRKHEIFLFSRNKSNILEINNTRKNRRYFPNKVLSKKIRATDKVSDLQEAKIIFICIPSHAVVDFFKGVRLSGDTILVNGAKGFGEARKLIPAALSEILNNTVSSMKGPSFADELIYELPTAFTIAARDLRDYELISSVFRQEIIIFDYTNDIAGIETLSILKNIYAIIIGIVDASFNSANVRFMLLTKAVREIKDITAALSIPLETIFKYGGIGDLALTALNDLSRNRTFGLLVGKGFFNVNISNTIALEGVRAIDYVMEILPTKDYLSFPLIYSLSKLLKNEINVNEFVRKVVYI